MTKEQVQERIKTLEAEREQVRSTLLAYEGALQDCKYWLEQLDIASKEKQKDTDG